MADDGRLDDPGLVQREEDPQRVRHQEDEDDAHEDHGQVVLVAPARLVVDRRLLVHALAPPRLAELDVLVDLESEKKRYVFRDQKDELRAALVTI